MGITAFYGATMPDDEALKLLKGVYNTGCRHFDTAEIYATGDKYNESILGEFFKTVPRDSYTVATKYYPKKDDPTLYTYDGVKASLQASLKRLQLDYVDVYYAHRVLTLEGGLLFGETAKRLKEEGLIKEVGLSEVSGDWLRQIHTKACPIDAVQQEWSLLTRNLESELVPVCKELDIPIVAYR
jgi:aryl-alcohol dehydrogenase-like predicted oxidoreductase